MVGAGAVLASRDFAKLAIFELRNRVSALQGEVGDPTRDFSVLLGCQEPALERMGSILN